MAQYMKFRVKLMVPNDAPWRGFVLRDSATFADLHLAIQSATEWENCHMHQFTALTAESKKGFEIGETIARMVQDVGFGDSKPAPVEGKLRLKDYFKRKGDKCLYNYDFGDDWWVGVEYEGDEEHKGKFKQKLLDGARAWPPDDFGGQYAWMDFVYGMKEPANKRDEDLTELIEEKLAWMAEMGIEFDAEAFDLTRAKKTFDLK